MTMDKSLRVRKGGSQVRGVLTRAERIARLKDALTAMDRHEDGRKVLALLRLDGFVATEPALFDTIAAKVDTVRRLG